MLVKLSPRLAMLASWVLPGAPMADIGTDHGLLPAYLVAAGTCPWAVAADVMPCPLNAAQRTAAAAGVAERIDCRLGCGLSVLVPGEVATAVLAGMGGLLMTKILQERPAVTAELQRVILQPNAGAEHLRRWIAAAGWHIIDENLSMDGGKIYIAMAVRPRAADAAAAAEAPTPADFILGPILKGRRDELFKQYVSELSVRTERAWAGARRAKNLDSERVAALAARRQLLSAAMEDLCGTGSPR